MADAGGSSEAREKQIVFRICRLLFTGQHSIKKIAEQINQEFPGETENHKRVLKRIRRAEEFGIKAPIKELNLQAIVDKKNGVIGDIRMGMEGLLGNNGVEVIKGRAGLKSPREVDVEGTIIETKNIIVATGSSLDVPDIPGLEEAALTTEQVLDMTDAPSSVLVCGGGPIDLEMVSLLNTFGAKVTIATHHPRILLPI